MSIRVLPDQVVNRIAAGEVIERPASVVRELVDNALDAGARKIEVSLEQGGRSLIRVLDDGCGMSEHDALLALERHATSKIAQAEDLDRIQTLGFRGEALPSIAAVSRMSLRTRCADASSATLVTLAGGTITEVSQTAAEVGTEICVRQLFFNTPVRRKFLRTPATEARRVRSWLSNTALAWPQVHFRLFLDGNEVMNLPPRLDSLARASELIDNEGERIEARTTHGVRIDALLGHPGKAQLSSEALVLHVNRRLVSDRILTRAVREGYLSTLKEREVPLAFVALSLPPDAVDVNVHPQKSEVRFRDPSQVFEALRNAVAEGVARFRSPVRVAQPPTGASRSGQPPGVASWKQMSGAAQALFTPPPIQLRGSHAVVAEPASSYYGALHVSPERPSHEQPFAQRSPTSHGLPEVAVDEPRTTDIVNADPFRFSELNFLAQLMECYLLCEHQGRLYVVDMHAAHERCNYNLIRERFRDAQLSSQQLLVPRSVPLSEAQRAYCLERQELFRRFGFEIEEFAGALLVRAAPPLLPESKVEEVVREVAAFEAQVGDEVGAESVVFERFVDHVSARLACHASIRSGQRISAPEVAALFSQLDAAALAAACPHGRPIVVSFSEREIEQWFGRDR